MSALFALAAAYLLGALPWSLWAGRLRGIDLRQHGSGNLGATNVYRVMGWKWGVAVLLLDVGKGVAAVALARAWAGGGAVPVLAGLAAVVGHMFTVFAGFRGGKGVATALGVFLGLAPLAAALGLGVWGAVLLLTGWVSVASGVVALVLPVFIVLLREDLGARYPWTLALAAVLCLLVLVRHRTNWQRVAAGTEQAIWENRPETPEEGAQPVETPR